MWKVDDSSNHFALITPTSSDSRRSCFVGEEGQNLFETSEEEGMKQRWTEMALVVQSALTSLNPVQTIESHFYDTLAAPS